MRSTLARETSLPARKAAEKLAYCRAEQAGSQRAREVRVVIARSADAVRKCAVDGVGVGGAVGRSQPRVGDPRRCNDVLTGRSATDQASAEARRDSAIRPAMKSPVES